MTEQGSLEERVALLFERDAIRQLLVDFVAGCDAGYDADVIIEYFTEDATMDLGPLGTHAGRDEIHAFFASISERIPFTVHLQTGYEITLEASGIEARGRWYGLETPTLDGEAVWGAFTYDDRYRKVGDHWLIAHLTQRFHFLTPYGDGWGKESRAGL